MRFPVERATSSAAAARAQERNGGDEEAPTAQAPGTTERTALLAELDRGEEKYYKLRPCESIYSFFMFMPSVEYRATGKRCNYILGFAIGLVVLNIMMQGGLMFVVSRDSFRKEDDMLHRLVHTNPPWYQFHKLWHQKSSSAACVAEDSLCVHMADKISCAPRSVALLQQWDHLDSNGDGIWSKSEAENATHRADMKCKYGSDPLVLHGSMIHNLQSQPSLEGRRHPNLVKGTEIHKAYFDWYLGEPLLCLHKDEDSCGNLFERGVFDEAIRKGAPFGKQKISDLKSAREYCSDLLRNRCSEQILPNTYNVWKKDAVQMCGTKEFTSVPYNSPDQSADNSVSRVRFQTPKEYQKYRSWVFMGYLTILLLTFFATLLAEWKDIYRTILYCVQFPHQKGATNDLFQRASVSLVTLLRMILWVVIGYGGTLFLTSKTDYLGMIFDALSLAFIITIDELIYATMLRAPMKSHHQELETIVIHRQKWWLSVHLLEFLLLAFVIGSAVAVAVAYQVQEMQPMSEALECLCSVEGSKCIDAAVHKKAWWDNYWMKIVPVASQQIDRLISGN